MLSISRSGWDPVGFHARLVSRLFLCLSQVNGTEIEYEFEEITLERVSGRVCTHASFSFLPD